MSVYLHGTCLQCGHTRNLNVDTEICIDCATNPRRKMRQDGPFTLTALMWTVMLIIIVVACNRMRKDQATRTNPVLLEETSHYER